MSFQCAVHMFRTVHIDLNPAAAYGTALSQVYRAHRPCQSRTVLYRKGAVFLLFLFLSLFLSSFSSSLTPPCHVQGALWLRAGSALGPNVILTQTVSSVSDGTDVKKGCKRLGVTPLAVTRMQVSYSPTMERVTVTLAVSSKGCTGAELILPTPKEEDVEEEKEVEKEEEEEVKEEEKKE